MTGFNYVLDYPAKDLHMHVNKYICYLAPEGSKVPTQSVLIEEVTHVGAAKTVGLMYPDLKILRLSQEWVPLDHCHICGTTIFCGDYQNDQILKRNGKNYCLDCR